MRKEEVKTYHYSYTVLFEPAEEGGYTVIVPALPGVVTEGDTLEDARKMAQDAIRLYIEDLVAEGKPVPTDVELRDEPVKEKVTVALNPA